MGDILEFWGQRGVISKREREWCTLNLAGILEETDREDVAQNSMPTHFVLV